MNKPLVVAPRSHFTLLCLEWLSACEKRFGFILEAFKKQSCPKPALSASPLIAFFLHCAAVLLHGM